VYDSCSLGTGVLTPVGESNNNPDAKPLSREALYNVLVLSVSGTKTVAVFKRLFFEGFLSFIGVA
jgi:hypothetical protein